MEINFEKLFDEGALEVAGHLTHEQCTEIVDQIWDDEMLNITFFLFRKEDGFARDTTNIYITDRCASFRPSADFWKAYSYGFEEDKQAFFKLKPLEIKPMLMSEYVEILKILNGK